MWADIYTMAMESPLDQALWALTVDDPAPFYGEDKSWYYDPGLQWSSRARTLTATGATYEEAILDFQRQAEEWRFGDGLPLIPPTPELVDWMLTGTTRDRNDMLGKIAMANGNVTVETVAVNAVMVGAKPEHLPVLIAAAESLGRGGLEEYGFWWHPMTTGGGASSIGFVVSGPITKEIGMENEIGMLDAGNSVNNTLSRAFRVFYQNIAHNYSMQVDTSGRAGRINDVFLGVFPENWDALQELGWESLTNVLGWGANDSSVTIFQNTNVQLFSSVTNSEANWAATLSTLNRPTAAPPTLSVFSPAHAAHMKEYENMGTKLDLVRAWIGATTIAPAIVYGAREGEAFPNRAVTPVVGGQYTSRTTYPVVAGPPSGSTYSFAPSQMYQTGIVTSTLIGAGGSAASTTARNSNSSPSAPTNIQVSINEAARTATITWEPPTWIGGAGAVIERYQVYMYDGGVLVRFDPIDVPGGAAARSFTFENLAPGEQYNFRVRAVNNIVSSIYYINRWPMAHIGGASIGSPITSMSTPPDQWLPLDKIRGLGAWGRAACADRTAYANAIDGLAAANARPIYSHTLPGRIRVGEIMSAMQNLERHQYYTRYNVRLPANLPFEVRQDIKYLSSNTFEYYRPGGDSDPRVSKPVITYPDSIIGWDAVAGATGYFVYIFDEDPVLNPAAAPLARRLVTTTLEFDINDETFEPGEYWLGVQALRQTAQVNMTNSATGTADWWTVPITSQDSRAAFADGAFILFAPVTSMQITTATGAPAPALVTVARNRTVQFGISLNQWASEEGIVWTTSNAGLATVDADGLVTIKNMVGTVTLTVTAPSGVSNSIVLRIS